MAAEHWHCGRPPLVLPLLCGLPGGPGPLPRPPPGSAGGPVLLHLIFPYVVLAVGIVTASLCTSWFGREAESSAQALDRLSRRMRGAFSLWLSCQGCIILLPLPVSCR